MTVVGGDVALAARRLPHSAAGRNRSNAERGGCTLRASTLHRLCIGQCGETDTVFRGAGKLMRCSKSLSR
jgi:hypothetical protein